MRGAAGPGGQGTAGGGSRYVLPEQAKSIATDVSNAGNREFFKKRLDQVGMTPKEFRAWAREQRSRAMVARGLAP